MRRIAAMGCFGFLKVMMFVFNGIIFLAGAAILGVGVWVKVDSSSLLGVLGKIQDAPVGLNQLVNVGYLLIAVGGVLLVMGFLGCCGAVRENKCMLLLFFIIVLIVFIAEVAAAVVLLVFKPLAESMIHMLGSSVITSIKTDYGRSTDLTLLWNGTMSGLKCCGYSNYTDFTSSPYYQSTSRYPEPCCLSLPCTPQSAASSNLTGCLYKILSLIQSNSTILIAVALGIAALEISAMVVSMTLYCKIGSE